MLTLPIVTPRTSRDMKLKRLSVLAEAWQMEEWQTEDQTINEDEEASIYAAIETYR